VIDWPGCRNVRDLGSVPGIRAGALVRSDSLTSLTADGIAAVRRVNVSRIVDLRTAGELAARPSPFAGEATYFHRSLYPDPIPPAPPDLTPVQEYAWLLDLSPDRIASAVGAIATAPPGTVVVHCQGGADRTGLVVALTLAAAGIERRAVVEDYVRSDGVWATTLTGALDHLDERYGGVQEYLGIGGLASGELSALRDRLVLDAPAG
jgi:hypothetical protein